ncbi:MAG: TolC family protein, partial [Kiloniellales bacterium]
ELESEYNDGRDGVADWEFNNQFMVRLDWNLFRGGIDRANRQEALSRMNEAKNRRYQSLVDAQQDVRQSWFALESNRQQTEDLTSAVRFNTETRNAYRDQFDVAQRTLLDVLDAENELFVSKGQLVTASTNETLAGHRVLALGGRLMAMLGVSAPEQAVVEHETWSEAVIGTIN